MGKITFVTGTDTGVGKTLLTACLLHHLRRKGINALAMKPFCSGSRSDARLLRKAGGNLLPLEEVNPFYFEEPLAPYAAARQGCPTLKQAVNAIHKVASKCDQLLVEGAGGILVPLGKNFFVADLIAALDCDVVLVARNKLGTINHTLLSVKALDPEEATLVLMAQKRADLSSRTNARIIREIQPKMRVIEIPYLGPSDKGRLEALPPRLRNILDRISVRWKEGKRKPRRNAV